MTGWRAAWMTGGRAGGLDDGRAGGLDDERAGEEMEMDKPAGERVSTGGRTYWCARTNVTLFPAPVLDKLSDVIFIW